LCGEFVVVVLIVFVQVFSQPQYGLIPNVL
jgi:hypothetical protein